MNITKLTQYLEALYLANNYTTFFIERGIPIPAKVKKRVIELYRMEIENPEFETCFQLKSDKLEYFFQYWRDEDIGKKIITSDFVIAPTWPMKKVNFLISEMFDKDKRFKTAHFYVPIKSKLFKQLLKLGALNKGSHLFGTVKSSLNYLRAYDYDPSIVIRDFRAIDLEEATHVEYQAQKTSDSTRCDSLSRKDIKAFLNSMLQKRQKVLLALEDEKVIGLIATNINEMNIAHIMAISVLPSEQGRGLSKLLYFEALKFLKSKKVKVYSGVSTTKEVLKLAHAMDRSARYAYLEFER